ncbi:glucosamine--fructose-6-phosphate aminotransferase [Desulfocucumis palustris]|uniref:Glucosamine--fructose-6-phosphate aminotransferase n=1 Tax=Desulfocucumis palustris TaxID=1898651 RepID=A0A2L2X6Q5_9FIRM|nr:glucosamine--fructose-6-phosphate aminotransferase [Desulfocucumis palustris]
MSEENKAEKGGFDHFMLKEIHEQPSALKDTLSGRINHEGTGVVLNEINMTPEEIRIYRKYTLPPAAPPATPDWWANTSLKNWPGYRWSLK